MENKIQLVQKSRSIELMEDRFTTGIVTNKEKLLTDFSINYPVKFISQQDYISFTQDFYFN